MMHMSEMLSRRVGLDAVCGEMKTENRDPLGMCYQRVPLRYFH